MLISRNKISVNVLLERIGRFTIATSIPDNDQPIDTEFIDTDGLSESMCFNKGKNDFIDGTEINFHAWPEAGNKKRSSLLMSAYLKGYCAAYEQFYSELDINANTFSL